MTYAYYEGRVQGTARMTTSRSAAAAKFRGARRHGIDPVEWGASGPRGVAKVRQDLQVRIGAVVGAAGLKPLDRGCRGRAGAARVQAELEDGETNREARPWFDLRKWPMTGERRLSRSEATYRSQAACGPAFWRRRRLVSIHSSAGATE